ncbi:hypothetical protein B0H11DRAFT_1925168 [Mycena galericulata]|nr:hypothetical protein B0H11DRAFT_1925168 [Mycena galericulata]
MSWAGGSGLRVQLRLESDRGAAGAAEAWVFPPTASSSRPRALDDHSSSLIVRTKVGSRPSLPHCEALEPLPARMCASDSGGRDKVAGSIFSVNRAAKRRVDFNITDTDIPLHPARAACVRPQQIGEAGYVAWRREKMMDEGRKGEVLGATDTQRDVDRRKGSGGIWKKKGEALDGGGRHRKGRRCKTAEDSRKGKKGEWLTQGRKGMTSNGAQGERERRMSRGDSTRRRHRIGLAHLDEIPHLYLRVARRAPILPPPFIRTLRLAHPAPLESLQPGAVRAGTRERTTFVRLLMLRLFTKAVFRNQPSWPWDAEHALGWRRWAKVFSYPSFPSPSRNASELKIHPYRFFAPNILEALRSDSSFGRDGVKKKLKDTV